MRTHPLTVGSAAVLALALAGCSSQSPATEHPPAEPAPPQAESGLIVETDPSALATTDQVQPDADQAVIVPSGYVSVDSLASAETIPANLTGTADNSSASDEGGGEELVPAEGEVFRVVTVTYSEPDDAEDDAAPGSQETGTSASEGAVLGFEMGEESQEQPDEGTGTRTYLVSAPEGADAFLTVTEEGKTQKVDLASGERDATTEAAGYYRQDPSGAGTSIELGEVEAEASSGLRGEVRRSATFAPQLTISGVEFTAWTPEQGWAEDGSAWLTIDGDMELGKSGDAELQAAAEVQGSLDIEGQEPTEFEVSLEKSGAFKEDSAPFSETIEVPADVETMTVTASGEVAVSASASWTVESDSSAALDEVEGEIPLE